MNPGLQPAVLSRLLAQAQQPPLQFCFAASGTFVAPLDGIYTIYLVGAGGSGAAIFSNGATGLCALGGNGAGFCIKSVFLKASETLEITIGSGGAAASAITSPSVSAGNKGGLTSVLGKNVALVIDGGAAGVVVPVGSGGDPIILSTAIGGDYNTSGGRGGNLTAGAPTSAVLVATGGGSAGSIYGNGKAGGDCTVIKSGYSVTGGASVSFDAADDTSGSAQLGCGAGTGNAALTSAGYSRLFNNTPGITGIDGTAVSYAVMTSCISQLVGGLSTEMNPFLRLSGGSAAATSGTVSGPGAGGSAALLTTVSSRAGTAGTCGGGGAAFAGAISLTGVYSGYAGIGGGSGATISTHSLTSAYSAPGGPGYCFISMRG